jgi:hypothetical protein
MPIEESATHMGMFAGGGDLQEILRKRRNL